MGRLGCGKVKRHRDDKIIGREEEGALECDLNYIPLLTYGAQ